MEKRTGGVLEMIFAVAIAAAVIYFSADIAGLGAYGYAGAFVIALLSSATIFFPAPGWAVVVALSATLDPVMLGAVAGIGSAIGELTGYAAGDGLRGMMNDRLKEAKNIEDVVKSYDVLAIFFLAFIPNPLFDVAGIVAGGLKIPWWRFVLACAAGRVLRYVLLAMAGAFAVSLLT
ncbi:VTT domain-containing protein [Candidatus Micrarchaeota archaeon]|nr:VTT domain-containing protein [Candidatus Micrarchaeota archaeon]